VFETKGLAGAAEWPEGHPAAKNCRIGYFGAKSSVQKLNKEVDKGVALFIPGEQCDAGTSYEDFGRRLMK